MTTMATTVDFTDHLKSIGAFKAFRSRRQAYESEGLTKKTAWEKAAREFGWRPHWTHPDEDTPASPEPPARGDWCFDISPKEAERMLGTEECVNRPRVEWAEAVKWVSCNLNNVKATPMTAPDATAWQVLLWAKSSPVKFFTEVLPKVMMAKAEAEQPIMEDDGRTEFKILEHFAVTCPHCGHAIS